MNFLAILCTAVNDGESFVSEAQPVFSDLAQDATDIATSASEFVQNFLNMDFINEIMTNFAKLFGIGFAFTTILVLITYGVFKAFSLIRID